MARREFDIRTVLDIPLWEVVQDKLSALTGTAIITIDYKGTPVTRPSGRTEFCNIIRDNPISRKRCCRCDALAGLEAVRLERPYIYLCHCGIVDVAVPVLVGNHYLGAVMFGQVRIPNGDTDAKVERLVSEISSFDSDGENSEERLLELYEKLPEMEYRRIEQIAELLNSIVHYIVDKAVKSHNDKQTYQWLLSRGAELGRGLDAGIQELHDPEMGDMLHSSLPVAKSSSVYPAVVHIHSHLQESISMKNMAELCHLSPSYFSRVFTRDVGENFVSYTNRQKILLSQKMLRETNKSISQISSELGFQDTSHFISLFKRYEGITPTVYRQYNYK